MKDSENYTIYRKRKEYHIERYSLPYLRALFHSLWFRYVKLTKIRIDYDTVKQKKGKMVFATNHKRYRRTSKLVKENTIIFFFKPYQRKVEAVIKHQLVVGFHFSESLVEVLVNMLAHEVVHASMNPEKDVLRALDTYKLAKRRGKKSKRTLQKLKEKLERLLKYYYANSKDEMSPLQTEDIIDEQ